MTDEVRVSIAQLELFTAYSPAVVPEVAEPLALKRRRRVTTGWDIVDHACRHCLGRVLVRRDSRGQPIESRCAECGTYGDGGHMEICCCGAECGTAGHVLECITNPSITPAVPQEVLVREKPVEGRRIERRRSNLVGGAGW